MKMKLTLFIVFLIFDSLAQKKPLRSPNYAVNESVETKKFFYKQKIFLREFTEFNILREPLITYQYYKFEPLDSLGNIGIVLISDRFNEDEFCLNLIDSIRTFEFVSKFSYYVHLDTVAIST